MAHRGPRSLESPESMHREVLDPLDDEAAKHILGDVDNAEAILARLGGHPLALQLHRPGMTLPEEGEGIEAFVTNAVLADLSKDERGAVEALALLPFAVPGDDLEQAEAVADLDERALLLWWATGGCRCTPSSDTSCWRPWVKRPFSARPEPALTIGPTAPAPSLR